LPPADDGLPNLRLAEDEIDWRDAVVSRGPVALPVGNDAVSG